MRDEIEKLSVNKQEWSMLSQKILSDEYVNSNLGRFICTNDLENSISKELINKGIVRISVTKDSICKEIEYSTNWTEYPIGTLYLIWDSCDIIKTNNGFYLDNFDLNCIEVWGVGDNWMICVDSDFI